MRFLFIKDRLAWPRSSGHDVHSYYLMRALAGLGHEVHFASKAAIDPQAVAGGGLASTRMLAAGTDAPLNLSKMQEKFRNYWGVPSGIVHEIGGLAKELKADVVVAVGLNVLPYLGAVAGAKRVWYAGDEWFWHHASQMNLLKPSTWGELKQAMVKGLYERVYAGMLDRVWMVSEADRKAWRRVTWKDKCDVLPNGIDAEHFAPGDEEQTPHSCVFWGRLDFGPNVQALEWFVRKVWPLVRKAEPNAIFNVYGFQPTPAVESLVKEQQGITLIPNLPDIRSEIRRHQVVVLPFVSGGGIKNKLLEAAAMGKAIVCTQRTVVGLDAGGGVKLERNHRGFANGVKELFMDAGQRRTQGEAARAWVLKSHTWEAAARTAVAGLGA